MKIHNHARTLRFRFLALFLSIFVVAFGLLNIRFLYANAQYWLAPGTITAQDSLSQIRPLPLAANIADLPLPDEARLVIDSIGVNAPIVFKVPADEKEIYNNLENGVVHYSTTNKPGENGVSVILGHSSAYPWYKGDYGSVFALLNKLKPGDKFYVQYSDNRSFVFVVKQSIVFNPFSADPRLSELEQSTKPTLVLLSCWPVGTNFRRIALQAELVEQ